MTYSSQSLDLPPSSGAAARAGSAALVIRPIVGLVPSKLRHGIWATGLRCRAGPRRVARRLGGGGGDEVTELVGVEFRQSVGRLSAAADVVVSPVSHTDRRRLQFRVVRERERERERFCGGVALALERN